MTAELVKKLFRAFKKSAPRLTALNDEAQKAIFGACSYIYIYPPCRIYRTLLRCDGSKHAYRDQVHDAPGVLSGWISVHARDDGTCYGVVGSEKLGVSALWDSRYPSEMRHEYLHFCQRAMERRRMESFFLLGSVRWIEQ